MVYDYWSYFFLNSSGKIFTTMGRNKLYNTEEERAQAKQIQKKRWNQDNKEYYKIYRRSEREQKRNQRNAKSSANIKQNHNHFHAMQQLADAACSELNQTAAQLLALTSSKNITQETGPESSQPPQLLFNSESIFNDDENFDEHEALVTDPNASKQSRGLHIDKTERKNRNQERDFFTPIANLTLNFSVDTFSGSSKNK
jgi:hypothetical protein